MKNTHLYSSSFILCCQSSDHFTIRSNSDCSCSTSKRFLMMLISFFSSVYNFFIGLGNLEEDLCSSKSSIGGISNHFDCFKEISHKWFLSIKSCLCIFQVSNQSALIKSYIFYLNLNKFEKKILSNHFK